MKVVPGDMWDELAQSWMGRIPILPGILWFTATLGVMASSFCGFALIPYNWPSPLTIGLSIPLALAYTAKVAYAFFRYISARQLHLEWLAALIGIIAFWLIWPLMIFNKIS